MIDQDTKAYLDGAFEKLATKEDVKGLATKESLAGLATKADLKATNANIHLLKEDVKSTKADLLGVKGDIAALKEDLKVTNSNLAVVIEDVKDMKSDVAETKTLVSSLHTSVDAYLKQTEDWHQEFSVLKARHDKLAILLTKKGFIREEELAV